MAPSPSFTSAAQRRGRRITSSRARPVHRAGVGRPHDAASTTRLPPFPSTARKGVRLYFVTPFGQRASVRTVRFVRPQCKPLACSRRVSARRGCAHVRLVCSQCERTPSARTQRTPPDRTACLARTRQIVERADAPGCNGRLGGKWASDGEQPLECRQTDLISVASPRAVHTLEALGVRHPREMKCNKTLALSPELHHAVGG